MEYGYGIIIVTAQSRGGNRVHKYALDSKGDLQEVLAAWILVSEGSDEEIAFMHNSINQGMAYHTLNLEWTFEEVINDEMLAEWQDLKRDGMDRREHSANLNRAEQIIQERKVTNQPCGLIGITSVALKPGTRMYVCKEKDGRTYLKESTPTKGEATPAWSVQTTSINLRNGRNSRSVNYFRSEDHALRWMLAISSSYRYDWYTREVYLAEKVAA